MAVIALNMFKILEKPLKNLMKYHMKIQFIFLKYQTNLMIEKLNPRIHIILLENFFIIVLKNMITVKL